MDNASQDEDVRMYIFETVLARNSGPSVQDASAALSLPPAEVEAAYRRLAEGRAIVLEPGTLTVRMANPLSAVPTPFRVQARGGSHFGNCVWDSLGVVAMLGGTGTVDVGCGCCGDPMTLRVEGSRLIGGDGIVHFAVPARRWWDDIVFT